MQILSLSLTHNNLFCPVTGHHILGDQHCDPSKATKGIWVDLAMEDPEALSPDLENAWKDYLENLPEDDWAHAGEFLKKIDQPSWICFEITTCGMACGPTSATVWVVIDMDCEESLNINQYGDLLPEN